MVTRPEESADSAEIARRMEEDFWITSLRRRTKRPGMTPEVSEYRSGVSLIEPVELENPLSSESAIGG